ncbi:hypothetical protein [Chryseobacterium gambrini]|uniref:hypothetical protein n=1 Tax=Chryseobacterium gambrini TaxID=373672 RepID=UPI0022F3E18A|nr:hypothetical protein [Chryseobacterium gambrini]WBX98003.1 hypothetical protein PE065_01820 [Chryseobacterium gambrini]
MKYLLTSLILLSCFVPRKAQIVKINKSNDIDILYAMNEKVSDDNISVFYLKNNTNKTFIIDPFGFWGNTSIYEDEQLLKPYKFQLKGYYDRPSDKWCERDLIILKPHEFKKLDFFNTNYKDSALYQFKMDKKYFEIIKSVHNKKTILYLGCEDYIRKLESKDFVVLEDSISAKIPIFPKKFTEKN